ncbi:hypothetical protein [Caballeronia sp. KNU42]
MIDQWKLVPVEPTSAMIDAGWECEDEQRGGIYRAMLAAAPTQGADARPFANCRYRTCDLPGQCRDEGHCHHPASGERGADARPVASDGVAMAKIAAELSEQLIFSTADIYLARIKKWAGPAYCGRHEDIIKFARSIAVAATDAVFLAATEPREREVSVGDARDIAQRFTLDTEPDRRANLQRAIEDAISAAIAPRNET